MTLTATIEHTNCSQKKISIKVLAAKRELIPTYASHGAAGADVRANLEHPVTIKPGDTALIPTGLKVELPYGYEMQIRPRSGLCLKHQVTVLNTPGTIDCDYRGEIGIILINLGKQDFVVEPNMRIAQCVIAEYISASFEEVEELASTQRGSGGFGHTGIC